MPARILTHSSVTDRREMFSVTYSTRLLALAAVALATACSSAPPVDGPQPAPTSATGADAITAAALEAQLTTFAHDTMLGRESGTLGNFKGTEYLAAEIERMGLEPAGENGTYFQTIPLMERALAPDASISVGGTELELGEDYLPLPPLGGMLPFAFGANRSLDGAEVVYGGQLGDTANMVDPGLAAGKLVIFTPSMGMGMGAFRMLRGFEDAAGIAMAMLHLLPAGVRNYLGGSQMYLDDGEATSSDGPMGMFIDLNGAEILLGKPVGNAEIGEAGGIVQGTFAFEEGPTPYPARNVIGIVRGSDPTLQNEYVAIGSHNDHDGFASSAVDHDSLWAFNHVLRPQGAEGQARRATDEDLARIQALRDSLGVQRPTRLDSIYNGADDDGSGSVTMLGVAEAFATSNPKPKRSVLFVWHTAEEKGLYGAGYFTDNPTVPRESIVANINLDMVGRGVEGDLEGGGPGYMQVLGSRRLSTELGDLVESVNIDGGFNFEFDYSYDADGHPQQFYCRSDHYMYARFGIPIVFFSTGSHQDYHMVTDESQYIDYDKMARISKFVYELTSSIANLDHRLLVDGPIPDPNAPCRQ